MDFSFINFAIFSLVHLKVVVFAKMRARLNRDHCHFTSHVNHLVDTFLIHTTNQQHSSTVCEYRG